MTFPFSLIFFSQHMIFSLYFSSYCSLFENRFWFRHAWSYIKVILQRTHSVGWLDLKLGGKKLIVFQSSSCPDMILSYLTKGKIHICRWLPSVLLFSRLRSKSFSWLPFFLFFWGGDCLSLCSSSVCMDVSSSIN